MTKLRIAVGEAGASCEACVLQLLNLEDLPAFVSSFDILKFRLAQADSADEQGDSYDAVFIEGSITHGEGIEKVRWFRRRTKLLVALGACAGWCGINGRVPPETIHAARTGVYGSYIKGRQVFEPIPLSEVTVRAGSSEKIKVDLIIPGCPVDKGEVREILEALRAGRTPCIPQYSMCTECKHQGEPCIYRSEGKGSGHDLCLGPITRAGCKAKCPHTGVGCFGCRGFVDCPNFEALFMVAARHGVAKEHVEEKINLINKVPYREYKQKKGEKK